ncbi:VOC family protein [Novipirellula sp. SH528]|uniref:VOC family protein n=1 Tax=Novipirellula sp. SH528 TaxID=3454466 RepID=UPI003F9EC7B5
MKSSNHIGFAVHATDLQSPIARFIDKRGEGVHHLVFLVVDLPARIDQLTKIGVNMIDTAARPTAEQIDIAFIHPNSCGGVLTELCQSRTR